MRIVIFVMSFIVDVIDIIVVSGIITIINIYYIIFVYLFISPKSVNTPEFSYRGLLG